MPRPLTFRLALVKTLQVDPLTLCSGTLFLARLDNPSLLANESMAHMANGLTEHPPSAQMQSSKEKDFSPRPHIRLRSVDASIPGPAVP